MGIGFGLRFTIGRYEGLCENNSGNDPCFYMQFFFRLDEMIVLHSTSTKVDQSFWGPRESDTA